MSLSLLNFCVPRQHLSLLSQIPSDIQPTPHPNPASPSFIVTSPPIFLHPLHTPLSASLSVLKQLSLLILQSSSAFLTHAMAPRTEKETKGNSAEIDDASLILDYLREQNRPYSAIEVSANLHNKVNKAQAGKILKDLHQKGEIEGRTAGKQIVYHALQKSSDPASPELLTALGQEITTLQEELSIIKANEKKARAALATLQAKPRLSALREEIRQLATERDAAQARVHENRSDSGDDHQPQISPAARAQLERDWTQWQRHARLRRRICRELWECCSEVLPEGVATAAELWETLGLEGEVQ
ncbi:Uncharacterized protein PECH_007653 [Penicillium ucsense]|uniref:Homologous-pairing protein 2 winged helix domain-containing protein n=1 Tax=Penicillium ucsense TaxID=2839758 RepID=A0A8J8WHL1_9EURO|nr:Uncharacterized protein PECM_007365 [Penicillium ucsense]KAF7734792.1 Uncharacterized protein PECH_007653 [Penicillium ucsense]